MAHFDWTRLSSRLFGLVDAPSSLSVRPGKRPYIYIWNVSIHSLLNCAMNDSFGETVSPVAAIRAILHDYPFSASILRELLQNSDDARARKQVRCDATHAYQR